MKLSILAGATSQSINVFVQNSLSTTGAGLTGLVFNTSGLTAYYTFAGANATAVAITLATLAAVNSAYSSGGFKEVDSVNMPGVYRLDVPNAAIASAKGRSVLVYLQGAANMAPLPLEIELTGWDNQDATAGGLSRIDAAISTRSTYAGGDTSGTTTLLSRIASALTITTGKVDVNDKTGFSLSAAGVQAIWDALTSALATVGSVGKLLVDNLNATVSSRMATFSLPANFSSFEIDGSGRVDVAKVAGTAQTARDIGASVLLSSGTGTGQLDFTSGVVKSNLAQILGTALTETAGQIAGAFKKLFNVASPTLTCLGVDQTGDNYARLGAPAGASVSADIAAAKVDTAAIKTKTDSLTFTNAGKVDANTLQVGGTAQTGRDLGASVLLSSGTGTGQVSLAAGKVSLVAADITAIEGGTWDVALSGHLTSGSAGAALNGAGSAGDPWTTPLPGAYGAGTAGAIVGTNLDAAVSSRSTYAGADTPGTTTLLARLTSTRAALLDNLDAAVSGVAAAVWASGTRTLTSFGSLVADVATAVWGAVTRSLTDKAGFTLSAAYDAAKTAGDATAANQTTINANVLSRLATTGYTAPDNAGIAAIKAKTDNLPASPAAVSDVPTANANADALLDRAAGVETGWTMRQAMRILLGVIGGKTNGANTTAMNFRNAGDTKTRVAATLDADGNRTAITYDQS